MNPIEQQQALQRGLQLPDHGDWMAGALGHAQLHDGARHIRTICECCDPEAVGRFLAARSSLPPRFLPFLDSMSAHEVQATGTRLFLTECGQGGYGLRGDHLLSVFSLPGAKLGPELVRDAIHRGARNLDTLDCNGKVVGLYLRAGFREVHRLPWDANHAPSQWNYELWGRPDLVIMKHDGV